MTIIFDIETGPLPEDLLAEQFANAWQPPPHPGEFDPASVKYGNTKDQAKRAEKLAECQQAHSSAVAKYEQTVTSERAKAWQEYLDGAALDATTGRVLAIGMIRTKESPPKPRIAHVAGMSESELLGLFWAKIKEAATAAESICGHNIFGFDLPFLIQRSYILGVDVPGCIRRNSRCFADSFVCTRELWQCGDRQCKSSLDHVAQAMGVGKKPEGITGADFARLFWSDVAGEREKALLYLANDLQMTLAVAERMGII